MKLNIIAIITIAFILGGCARWQKLDGSEARLDEISKAKLACNYDASLVALQTRELGKDTAVLSTSDQAEKDALNAEYESHAKKVYAGLKRCMQDQGLKKIQ